MPPLYANDSPAQSTSSLSDLDEDQDRADISEHQLKPVQMSWSRSHSTRQPQPPAAVLLPIDTLPPELLIHVLRQIGTRDLYASLLVSRRWCECGIQLVWHKPNIRDLRRLRRMLLVLNSTEPSFIYTEFIRRLNLSLLHNELTDQDLRNLKGCSKLERLTLMNCKQLSDAALSDLLRCTPELVALDLSGIPAASDATLEAVADTSPKLQGLNISNCGKMTDVGVTAVALRCRFLRRIKLMGLDKVTDASLDALASNCPRLLELDLTKCTGITDIGVRKIWSLLVDLRELKVSYCTSLTDTAHPAPPPSGQFAPTPPTTDILGPLLLTHRFDHFRILELSGCVHVTDDAIAGITGQAHRIRSLSLAKCAQLTDNALRSICTLGRHLHDVHLGHVSQITDSAVVDLARHCTRLRYIDLACCGNLSDVSVIALAALPKLRRIGLVRVLNLTDDAVYALADRPPTLERIHLSYCDNISVMAVALLLERLPRLMHLSLTGVSAFRDSELGLQRFCRTPPTEFTENQRAAFCVFSGQGVRDLRAHLHSLTVAQERALNVTESDEGEMDDDQEEFFPGDATALPTLGYPTAMDPRAAFLAAPNVVQPRFVLANGMRADSFGAAASSTFTTPEGATPRPGASVSSLQLASAHAHAQLGMHAAFTGRSAPSLGNGMPGGHGLGVWQPGDRQTQQVGASELHEQLRQWQQHQQRHNQPHHGRHPVPFPADDSAVVHPYFTAGGSGVLAPTPSASTSASAAREREDESRGRRVRRSLRNTAEHIASSIFGRGGGGGGAASSSGAR